MASMSPSTRSRLPSTASSTPREHALGMVFLFAGPAFAFVLAVLLVR